MVSPARSRPLVPSIALFPMPLSGPGRSVAMLAIVALLGGCSTMHMKRAAYQMLRQGDCRLNQLDEFCHRNFAAEFHAYDRLRRDFMLGQRDEPAAPGNEPLQLP